MIDAGEVLRIAKLARLKLTEDEVRLYQEQLGRILEHMGELNRLDTRDVQPTSHALGLTNVMREDEERPFPDAPELLAAAPDAHGRYFKVPKVLE